MMKDEQFMGHFNTQQLLFSRSVSMLNFWMDVEVGCALTPNWGNFSSHSKQAIVITIVLFLERIR